MEYLLIEFLEDDESKWEQVKNHILPKASYVEFNILYSDSILEDFKQEYKDSIVSIIDKKEKTYQSGKILRLRLTDKVKNFVNGKSFASFKNWILEDPSFYIDGKEAISTISHEDQIYFDPHIVDMKAFSNFKLEHKLFKEESIGFWQKLRFYLWRYWICLE